MKKQLIYFILVMLTITSTIFADDDFNVTSIYDNDYINFDLKGQVKTIIQKDIIPVSDYSDFKDGKIVKTTEVEINEFGYCSYVKYYEDSQEYTKKNTFSYTKNKSRRTGFYLYNQDKNCILKKVFSYNQNGQVGRTAIYYPQKMRSPFRYVMWLYDDNGNLSEKRLLTKNQNLKSVINFTTNKKGKITSSLPYDFGKNLNSSYSYNNRGQITDSVEYFDDKRLIKKYVYEKKRLAYEYFVTDEKIIIKSYKYNDRGLISSITETDKNDNIHFIEKFIYDGFGNFTKKATFIPQKNGRLKMTSVKVREITYY